MVGIFLRTFGQLFAPYVALAVAAAQIGDYNVTETQLVVGLVMAVAGALIAVLAALTWRPSADRLEKAIRSAVEAIIVLLGGVAVDTIHDVFALPHVLLPGLIGVAGAFVYTYLTNTDAPPA